MGFSTLQLALASNSQARVCQKKKRKLVSPAPLPANHVTQEQSGCKLALTRQPAALKEMWQEKLPLAKLKLCLLLNFSSAQRSFTRVQYT